MASFVLGAVGSIFGGPLGGIVGSLVGGIIDQALFGTTKHVYGPRLSDLNQITGGSPGEAIKRVWGKVRVTGTPIYSSGLVEVETTTTSGSKFNKVKTTTYSYYVNTAILISKGPIAKVHQIYADKKLIYNIDDDTPYSIMDSVSIYLGSEDQEADSVLSAANSDCPAYRGRAYVVFSKLQLATLGNHFPSFEFVISTESTVTVADIVSDILTYNGVPSSVNNAAALSTDWTPATVTGFAIASAQTGREAINLLQDFYLFSGADVNGTLTYRRRSRSPDYSVYEKDMGSYQSADDRPPWATRMLSSGADLPREVVCIYQDSANSWQSGLQRALKKYYIGTGTTTVQASIALEPSTALKLAWEIMSDAWCKRRTITAKFPPKYAMACCGDVVRIIRTDATTFDICLTKVTRGANLQVEIEGRYIDPVTTDYDVVPGVSTATAQSVLSVGNSNAYLLDLPALTDTDASSLSFYVAFRPKVYSTAWPGAALYLDDSVQVTGDAAACVGIVSNTLDTTVNPYSVDRASSIKVVLTSDVTLETITESKFWSSTTNTALIGDEIVHFKTAELTATNTYTLSTFIRGVRGTEWAIAGHESGETFILLTSSGIGRVGDSTDHLNSEYTYTVVTSGLTTDTGTDVAFENTGANLKPWAPDHVKGTRDSSGDLTLTWVPRVRYGGGWNNGIETKIVDTPEAYEIAILSSEGSDTTLRVISISEAKTGTYTVAQQIEDFGVAQSTVYGIIFQISPVVGRGFGKSFAL